MSDNPTAIRANKRIKTVLASFNSFEGVDNAGPFQTTAAAFGVKPVTTGLVASTTHTIAGATPLSPGKNVVATTANANDAVVLPAMTVGQSVDVYNNGAAVLAVYPNTALIGIDAASVGVAVPLTAGKRATFTLFSATLVLSAQLGAASA